MKREKIGISVASLLPFSLFLPLAALISVLAGYKFWQELPLRFHYVWLLKFVLQLAKIEVLFVERAWNPTTCWKHFFTKEQGAEGMPTKVQDVAFFPKPGTCAKRVEQILETTKARLVGHYLKGPALIEIHPGLGTTIPELLTLIQRERHLRFVLDTKHYLLMPDSQGPEAEEQLKKLVPLVVLVHVQARNPEEWKRFLAGEKTGIGDLLSLVKTLGYTGPYVVEYPPTAGGKRELIDPIYLARNLKMVRERLEAIIS